MRVVWLCAAFALVAGASAQDEAVVTVTKDNWDEVVANSKKDMMVEFYAPWCGHCKTLAPEFEKAAQTLKGEVVLAKVDATVEPELAAKFEVKGYPTLLVMRAGQAKPEPYEGGRTADDIVSWLKLNTGTPVDDLEDAAAVAGHTETAFKAGNVVYVAHGPKNGAERAAVDEAAGTRRKLATFLWIEDATRSLKVLRDEGDEVMYSGPWTGEAVGEWVDSTRFPLFGQATESNVEDYGGLTDKKDAIVWTMLAKPDDDVTAAEHLVTAKPIMHALARKYPKVLFVWLNTTVYAEHAQDEFGLKEADFPAMLMLRNNFVESFGAERHLLSLGNGLSNFSEAVVSSFVDNSLALKHSTHFRSVAETKQADAPVKTVVGTNFATLLPAAKAAVMQVYFKASCEEGKGTCADVRKWFDVVARKLGDVTFAIMDLAANDWPLAAGQLPAVSSGESAVLYKAAGSDAWAVVAEGGESKELGKWLKASFTLLSSLPDHFITEAMSATELDDLDDDGDDEM